MCVALRTVKSVPAPLRGLTPKARSLVSLLAIAGLGVLLAVMFLLQASLSDIAAKSDQLEGERSHELVDAALQGLLGRVGAMATDNSAWDAAVTATYGARVDTRWADENWGPGAEDAKPYDGIYVLDQNASLLWGTFKGQRLRAGSSGFLGQGFHTLLAKERANIDQGRTSYTGLTLTPEGLAIVAVAQIHPAKGPFAKLGVSRRYIVMTRHLTPAVVAALGQSLKLEDFHLAASRPRVGPAFDLKDSTGKVVGQFHWVSLRSGEVAVGAGRVEADQVVLLVGGLVIMLMAFAGYAIHRLATSEREARQVSLTDPLSQLPNRRALYQRLADISRQAGSRQVSIVFVDLDGFKHINDVHGHTVGDELIRALAEQMTAVLPAEAMLVRMGGDEFALLSAGPLSDKMAESFSRQVLQSLASPVRLGERLLKPGASLGIATADLTHTPLEEVLRRADVAMYHAKETGKGRLVVYDPSLDQERVNREAIESGIRAGLDRDEFDVVYQPIVDARTHAMTGVEALIRWPRRPEGPLAPDVFIPIAEESGLIQALGLFVLDRACRDLTHIRDLRLSVNVSPVQFRNLDFELQVVDILARTGFPTQRLELELTEGYLVENPDRAIAVITKLHALGVQFALDDFGTGYSSIGYLKRFQFDRIKIDKSLASVIDCDPQAGALVSGTIHIARALSMAVTAEGVESEVVAKALRLAGCTCLQGYYFGKPGALDKSGMLVNARDAQTVRSG